MLSVTGKAISAVSRRPVTAHSLANRGASSAALLDPRRRLAGALRRSSSASEDEVRLVVALGGIKNVDREGRDAVRQIGQPGGV